MTQCTFRLDTKKSRVRQLFVSIAAAAMCGVSVVDDNGDATAWLCRAVVTRCFDDRADASADWSDDWRLHGLFGCARDADEPVADGTVAGTGTLVSIAGRATHFDGSRWLTLLRFRRLMLASDAPSRLESLSSELSRRRRNSDALVTRWSVTADRLYAGARILRRSGCPLGGVTLEAFGNVSSENEWMLDVSCSVLVSSRFSVSAPLATVAARLSSRCSASSVYPVINV